jgi:putative membrane protein
MGLLLERGSRLSAAWIFVARWIAESINNLLPVAQIGGDVIRARLATRSGMSASRAAASVVGDVTAGLLSELAFAAEGFILLIRRRGFENMGGILACIIVLGVLVACLVAAQVSGMMKPIVHRLTGFLKNRMRLAIEAGTESFQSELSALYARRAAFAASACCRLLAWGLGAMEVYLALWFLGSPVGILDALLLESLSQALRSAAFFIPGALGVQEGGFVLLGSAVGIGPDVSLSLSLIKRARELLLGLPGILAWQFLEARSLSRAPAGYQPPAERKAD